MTLLIDREVETPIEVRPRSIEFSGFSQNQEIQVRALINAIGLPTTRVRSVTYLPEEATSMGNTLGHWDNLNGELALYKSLENLPLIAQMETIVHEEAHACSPNKEGNEELYGGKQAMAEARNHAILVAKQSLSTNRYLNGYHEKLAEAFKARNPIITEARFIEETHAIMAELRFTNPKHLEQVEEAQKAKITKLKKSGLLEPGTQAVGITEGIENTLMNLMPQFESREQLDQHIKELRASVIKQK